MYGATQSTRIARAVDNTDWLKTAAIVFVVADHIGYFFLDGAPWWIVVGRLAAPTFFFLLGYAHTRTVPLHWIWLGIILTLLESANAKWTWVAPNILLSFVLIRLARPYAQKLLARHGWVAFIVLTAALIASLPVTAKMIDYGTEGWLWALFGLLQRMHVDSRSSSGTDGAASSAAAARAFIGSEDLMRLLAGLTAASVYIWQEQQEHAFAQTLFAVFVVELAVLTFCLYLFERGTSLVQPPQPVDQLLRFIGRHTLEIYAIQLAGSELIVMLWPDFSP